MGTESVWPILLMVAVSSFASIGFWTVFFNNKNDDDMRILMKGLAYYRLIAEITKHLQDGKVTKEEYDSIYLHLYRPYEKLGGEGLVKIYMQNLLELLMKSADSGPETLSGLKPKYMTDDDGNQYKLEQL